MAYVHLNIDIFIISSILKLLIGQEVKEDVSKDYWDILTTDTNGTDESSSINHSIEQLNVTITDADYETYVTSDFTSPIVKPITDFATTPNYLNNNTTSYFDDPTISDYNIISFTDFNDISERNFTEYNSTEMANFTDIVLNFTQITQYSTKEYLKDINDQNKSTTDTNSSKNFTKNPQEQWNMQLPTSVNQDGGADRHGSGMVLTTTVAPDASATSLITLIYKATFTSGQKTVSSTESAKGTEKMKIFWNYGNKDKVKPADYNYRNDMGLSNGQNCSSFLRLHRNPQCKKDFGLIGLGLVEVLAIGFAFVFVLFFCVCKGCRCFQILLRRKHKYIPLTTND